MMVSSEPYETANESLIIESAGVRVRILFAPQANTEIAEHIVELLTNSLVENLCSQYVS